MFYNFFSSLIFFFATMVIFCQNSLYSILSLVFTIVGSCYILFSLQVEFLTFLLLLIYIGAITVLFLFVVMMLQLHQDSHKPSSFFMFTQNIAHIFARGGQCLEKLRPKLWPPEVAEK